MVGLLIYFERHQMYLGPVLVVVATAGSLLVSYVRARAQSLGFSCEGGLLARPERVLLTVVGLLLTPWTNAALLFVVLVLAVLSIFTVVQRMVIVWRQSRPPRRQGGDAEVAVSAVTAAAASEGRPSEGRPIEREVRQGPEPAGG
jgi:phosphatidylglycerophosphate synthase